MYGKVWEKTPKQVAGKLLEGGEAGGFYFIL